MKKVFVLAMVISFIWVLPAMAWQNPCSATENSYNWEGCILGNWTSLEAMFSPAPECEGIVVLLTPDGTWYFLDYLGNKGVLTLTGNYEWMPDSGISCRVSNDGNLICEIITQPEESTMLLFKQEK